MLKLNEFIRIGRALFEEGIIHSTSGNISQRDGDSFYITAHDSYAAALTSDQIIRVNVADKKRDKNASVEVDVHRAVYKNTSAQAIVHAHPVFATTLSFEMDVIKPIDAEGSFYMESIPVIDALDAIGSEELIMKLPAVLAVNPVCIVKRHGSWAAAGSLLECYKRSSVLESACKILYYKILMDKSG